ncbi:MAG: GyrI-like domain-containing protein [Vicingaceae bacterium]
MCCIITAVISLFLPSEVKLHQQAIIDADKTSVKKQLKTFSYNRIAGYTFSENGEFWEFNDVEDGFQLVSEVELSLGFNPLTKFLALFNRQEMEAEFQQKFDSLRIVLEELPKIQGVDVSRKMMEEDIWFLSIRDTISQMNMNNVHGRFYDEIKQFLSNDGLETIEPPIVIYHSWSDTLIDIEVGISVKDSLMEGSSRVKMNKIERSNVVTATHYGVYERLPETYFGINEWMRSNKVMVTGPPWEIYLTDPSTESNPKKWETAIYFPIAN